MALRRRSSSLCTGTCGLALAVGLAAVCLAPSAAEAAPRVQGAKDKRFRLHFDLNLFDLTHIARTDGNPDNPNDRITNVGFGVGRPKPTDGFAPRNVFGLGFGYVFLGDRAVVGARVAMLVDGNDVGDRRTHNTTVSGLFMPYFHWMFLPGRWVRPYVEGRVGFGGGTITDDEDINGDGTVGRITRHVIVPNVGVGGGVHLFPVEYFSVDLGLDLDYLAPHTRQTFRNPDRVDTHWFKDSDVVVMAIRLGASVFF